MLPKGATEMSERLTQISGPLTQGQCEYIPGDKAIPSSSATFATALSYVDAAFSVIPIEPNGTKAPCARLLPREINQYTGKSEPSWKVFQDRKPTLQELNRWWYANNTFRPPGIAIVCGRVSGGLEVIDLDNEAIAEEWFNLLASRSPGLLGHLPIVMTPRPGFHVYYRRNGGKAGGSHKLAQGAGPAQPSKPKTLIEMKGEGGYVLAPGCSAACHETGRLYVTLGTPAVTEVPVIDDTARESLLYAARSLNRWTVEPRRVPPQSRRLVAPTTLRPGDVFEARVDWATLLEAAGWTFVGSTPEGEERWRRPGKQRGISATVDYAGLGRLYVFTTSAHPFEPGRMYSKFQAYALLHHRGDFRAAARALRSQGFGGRPSFSTPVLGIVDRIAGTPLLPVRCRQ
jgi:putative DNA primase/helicase